MEPMILVSRKGENIFLTIKGEINSKSTGELLVAVRKLLITSLKCAAPGTRVTYCVKTRAILDLGKISSFSAGNR